MGEEVVIAKAGTPVAKLVPIENQAKTRVLGSAKGEFIVPDNFNEPDSEVEDSSTNESTPRYACLFVGSGRRP
jgi:antitoxin (DNA-binding transcriptional repressor) of toxin-antitoxin stability system